VRKVIRPNPIRHDRGTALISQAIARIISSTRRPATLSRLAIVALALVASGCGYHFAAEGSGLPPQAKTIYVEKFGNRTRQTGINDEFMRFVADEISNHKRLQMVDSASDADLVLSGEIIYADTIPTAFNSAAEPTIYTQTITADASLLDAHDHKVIWSTRGVSSSPQQAPVVGEAVVTTSPYFVQQNLRSRDIASMQDIQVAQTQGASSKQQAMQTLAQNLYASMSEGF
jgi:outer membrane lipopolysaccharide assembly protein LptE/RlpB